MAVALNNLAVLYYNQGQYEKAKGLYVRALAIGEKVLGAQHLDTAQLPTTLALCYLSQKQYTKAEPLFVRTIAIYEKALGLEHPRTISILGYLARFYWSKGVRFRLFGIKHVPTTPPSAIWFAILLPVPRTRKLCI